MYNLPISVEIEGASFGIRNKGDFRMVLNCFKALNDVEFSDNETIRLYTTLILFYEDFHSLDDLFQYDKEVLRTLQKEMVKFFNGGEETVKSNTENFKTLDWDYDAALICSAVNNVAHTEIRAEKYIHWWTFLGYYMAIGDCLLSEVVSIRYKTAKGKKLEKYEQKFKQDHPQYFSMDMRTTEQKEADAYIRQLWGDS